MSTITSDGNYIINFCQPRNSDEKEKEKKKTRRMAIAKLFALHKNTKILNTLLYTFLNRTIFQQKKLNLIVAAVGQSFQFFRQITCFLGNNLGIGFCITDLVL